MYLGFFDKVIAITVCVALVCAPLSGARAATTGRDSTFAHATDVESRASRPSVLIPPSNHFLRDAVPSAGFAVEPEDTTDGLFLPEEQDNKKLFWDIAAWVVGAAIVGFFIIKVFIEQDEPEQPKPSGPPKPDPF